MIRATVLGCSVGRCTSAQNLQVANEIVDVVDIQIVVGFRGCVAEGYQGRNICYRTVSKKDNQ
jgi:hypothetical protein